MKFDFEDTVLADAVKNFISAMLPHDNYKGEFFSLNFNSLTEIIHVDEMQLEYRILCELLSQLSKIQSHVHAAREGSSDECEIDNAIRLDSEQVELYLNASLDTFISKNVYDVTSWMASFGKQVDLSIAGDYEESAKDLASAVLNLYDECFTLSRDSSQVPVYSTMLLNAMKDNAIEQASILGNKIRMEGIRIDRTFYRGSDGWVSYFGKFQTEFNERLSEQDDSLLTIDNPEIALLMRKRNKEQCKPIAKWGIPALDDLTPIMTNRYVVLAAEPNVGKTTYMAGTIVNNILEAGKKVCYISGESTTNIPYNLALSNFIHRNLHVYVKANQIGGIEPIGAEAARELQIGEIKMAENGGLSVKEAIHYDNAFNDLKALYDKTHADVYIIDHSMSMSTSPGASYRSAKDKIDVLSHDIVKFKNKYPVCVILLSHWSAEAKEDFKRTGVVSSTPTRMSGDPTSDADDLLIMYTTPTMVASDIVGIQCYKRRNAPRFHPDVYLKVEKDIMQYSYLIDIQPTNANEVAMEMALDNISSQIGSNSSDDITEFANNILNDDDE